MAISLWAPRCSRSSTHESVSQGQKTTKKYESFFQDYSPTLLQPNSISNSSPSYGSVLIWLGSCAHHLVASLQRWISGSQALVTAPLCSEGRLCLAVQGSSLWRSLSLGPTPPLVSLQPRQQGPRGPQRPVNEQWTGCAASAPHSVFVQTN